MRVRQFILLACAPALVSCSTLITPRSIAASDAPAGDRDRAVLLFEQAVEQANTFLASSERRSLPAGRLEEVQDGSLQFVTPTQTWPIRIRHSVGGDLVVASGFRAQERDDGFVVGVRPPARHLETDNSMFRYSDGDWHDAESIASLILHETAHTVHREGTVGYWNTFTYYVESIFLLRAANHSAERIPRGVSSEFFFHRLIEDARRSGNDEERGHYEQAFEEHLAEEREHCVHLDL